MPTPFVVVDDFNRVDAVNLGANWAQAATGADARAQIVSNRAKHAAVQGLGMREQWVGSSFVPGPDIEVEYVDTSSHTTLDSDHGIAVRWDATTDDFYGVRLIPFTNAYEVFKILASAYTALSTGATNSAPFVSGASLRLRVVGTRITATYNAVQLAQVTDTAIADNERRFGFFGWNDTAGQYVEIDNYIARNIGPWKVADRGSLANVTTGTTALVDMAAAGSIAIGNVLVARVAADNAGTSGAASLTTVTDARNGTWTQVGIANADPGVASAGVTTAVYYVVVRSAYTNGDDVTVNFNPTTVAKAVVVEEWANIDTLNPIAVAATTGTGTTTVSAAPLSRTPTAAEQTVYAAVGTEGPNADSYTEDTDTTGDCPWRTLTALGSTDATATNNVKIVGASKTVNDTSAQSWGPGGTSRDWAAVMFVFNPAPDPWFKPRSPYISLLPA